MEIQENNQSSVSQEGTNDRPAYFSKLAEQILGDNKGADASSSAPPPAANEGQGSGAADADQKIAEEKAAKEKAESEAKSAAEAEESRVKFESFLSEKSKGKFKSEADFVSHIEKLEKLIDPDNDDEAIKEFRSALKNGMKKEDFFKVASQNYDGMSEKSLYIAKMKKSDPNLTDELADLIFEREFKVGDQSIDDKERSILDYQLKKVAEETRAEFKAEQAKLLAPAPPSPNDQKFETDLIEATKKFKSTIDSQAEKLKEVQIALGKNEETGAEYAFNFKFDESAITDAKSFISDPVQFLGKMLKGETLEQTEANIGNLLQNLAFAMNKSSFERDLFTYAKSLGMEEIIQKKQGAQKIPESNTNTPTPETNPAKIAANHMLGVKS